MHAGEVVLCSPPRPSGAWIPGGRGTMGRVCSSKIMVSVEVVTRCCFCATLFKTSEVHGRLVLQQCLLEFTIHKSPKSQRISAPPAQQQHWVLVWMSDMHMAC